MVVSVSSSRSMHVLEDFVTNIVQLHIFDGLVPSVYSYARHINTNIYISRNYVKYCTTCNRSRFGLRFWFVQPWLVCSISVFCLQRIRMAEGSIVSLHEVGNIV